MTLNLLPHRFTKPTFHDLKREPWGTLTKKLLESFENTWIKHRTWKPCTWSLFMLAMCTNNPLEWYHGRLKRLANNFCYFFRKVDIYFKEKNVRLNKFYIEVRLFNPS